MLAALADELGWAPAQARSIAESNADVNLWTGAVGSGKTVGSLWRWLLYCANAPTGGDLVVVGRTRESISRNVFGAGALGDPTVFKRWSKMVSYNAGAPNATILGRKVVVLGASDVRSESVLRGMNCAGAYIDEATLINEDFWMQLQQRIRVPGAKVFATTNPDGPQHWLKRHVIDKATSHGHNVFHFTIHDNPHLPSDYYSRLLRELTGLWRRRMIDGEWCVAEGAVYEQWNPDIHVIPHDQIPRIERMVAMGIDYGTTNATRGYLIGLGRSLVDGKYRLYVVDEWAPPRGTDGQLSADLMRWLDGRHRPEWIITDPAGASFKQQLFFDGLNNVSGAINDVIPGIRTVASLMAGDALRVSERCEQLIRYLPSYSWDPKATDRGEDAPIKKDDHEVDALRYGIMSSRVLWHNYLNLAAKQGDDMAA